jgi:regulatory protein
VNEDEARRRAMALLAKRDCSRAVLARRLSALGAGPDVIDAVLAQLGGWGYLDDDRMATSLTRRRVGQGLGPRRIRQALREAGLPGEIPAEGLKEAFARPLADDQDETDTAAGWERRARDVWLRRFGHEPAEDPREQARRIRFMLSRGFIWEQFRACIPGQPDDFGGHDPEPDD